MVKRSFVVEAYLIPCNDLSDMLYFPAYKAIDGPHVWLLLSELDYTAWQLLYRGKMRKHKTVQHVTAFFTITLVQIHIKRG